MLSSSGANALPPIPHIITRSNGRELRSLVSWKPCLYCLGDSLICSLKSISSIFHFNLCLSALSYIKHGFVCLRHPPFIKFVVCRSCLRLEGKVFILFLATLFTQAPFFT